MKKSTGPLWLWIVIAVLLLAGVSMVPPQRGTLIPWGIAFGDATIIPVMGIAVILHWVWGWIIRRL